MPFYVAQVVSTVTRLPGALGPDDPGRTDERAEGVDGVTFADPDYYWAIDLRPIGVQRAIVFSTIALVGPTLLSAVEDDPLTAAVRASLANRFPGLDFSTDSTVRDALKRILLPHIAADASGMREIRFGRRLVYRGQ